VGHHSEVFIGIDTSKLRNAVAIAEGGRGGEVRFLGEFPATEAAVRKLVAKLAAKYRRLTFCYEAGPTGYWLYRLIKSLGRFSESCQELTRTECRASCPPIARQTQVCETAH
jgi:transposase